MIDDFQLTNEQLQLATTLSLPAGTQLDSETAPARESFLALGRTLESAAEGLDEAAILAKLAPSHEQTCSRSASGRYGWPLVVSIALAASALFAIVRIANMATPGDSEVANLNQDSTPFAAAQHPAAENRASVGWNDALDDEIALAAATIEQIRGRGRGFDSSLIDMNMQLEALSQELLRESL